VAAERSKQKREGVSLQTLVLAALSSAVAAIVVSHFWKGGTVIASAMTPVIVALVKDLLARPMQSDLVRRPVRRVSEVATSRGTFAGVAAERGERVRPALPDRPATPPAAPNGRRFARPDVPLDEDGRTAEGLTPGDVLLSHPRRTYGTPARRRRRPLHLKVALVTGLLAFVLAAAALTLPELVFGGAVASHRSTTFFGGGSSSQSQKQQSKPGGSTQQPTPQKQPQTTQTTPQQQPTSTTPQAPQPSAPPSGGQPAPAQPQSPAPGAPPPSSGGGTGSP